MELREAVQRAINNRPFLQEMMEDGLINLTALARDITEEVEKYTGKRASQGALVMAIRRMEPSYYFKFNHNLRKFLEGLGDVIVRSALCSFTYRNTPTLYQCQQSLLKIASERRDIFCSFSQGIHETTLIISDAIKNDMQQFFKGETVVSNRLNLASVTVKLPKENTEISGLYYFILKKLAWEGINITEMISTSNEFTVVVSQNDLERTFGVMHRLREQTVQFTQ
jgi:hypothetical protein